MDRTICYHSASLPCLGGCVPPRDGYIVHGCSGTYFAAKYLEVSQGVCDLASSVGSWPRICMYDRERRVYMSGCSPLGSEPAPHACAFYRRALLALQAAQVPFLVGGGYALAHYVGIIRHTKDFDIFVYPHHCAHALEVLRTTGYYTELTFPHWLGVVLHYSPIRDTVVGEPPEIFAFLGSSRLEEPLHRYAVTAVFHGHAHHGTLEGHTTGGIPVYNVAVPLLHKAFPDRPPFRLVEIPVTPL